LQIDVSVASTCCPPNYPPRGRRVRRHNFGDEAACPLVVPTHGSPGAGFFPRPWSGPPTSRSFGTRMSIRGSTSITRC